MEEKRNKNWKTERVIRKKSAREVLRRHYVLLVLVCLVALVAGGKAADEVRLLKQTVHTLYAAYESGDFWEGMKDVYALQGITLEDKQKIEEAWELRRQIEEKEKEDVLFYDILEMEGRYNSLMESLDRSSELSKKNQSAMFGRSNGVFAQVINGFESGNYFMRFLGYLRKITGSDNLAVFIFALLAVLVSFLAWFLISNVYIVIQSRFFLESRIYEKIPFSKFLFLVRTRKWLNVSWVMFVRHIFQLLWSLTIVGGVIKRYSYYMVPYIMAENPEAGAKEAITLSRRMMRGHKWECFVSELSFLLWDILGLLTFGILRFVYVEPYRCCYFAEYYAALREEIREKEESAKEILCDDYLYRFAGEEELVNAYAAAAELEKEDLSSPIPEERSFRCFLLKYFGVSLYSDEEDSRYDEVQAKKQLLSIFQNILAGKTYPGRLGPIPEKKKNPRIESVNYLRSYSPRNIILLFFLFSFIGWLWEVGIHLVEDGIFVNRGVLHGPWLPIYGSGGVLILVLLASFRKKPWLEFVSAVVLCGIVEYWVSFFLEKTQGGTKWWDYTGYFINLHGRISAEGLVVFGAGGFLAVYVFVPLLDDLLQKINRKVAIAVCAVLLIVFVADQIYSTKHPNVGKGITDYAVMQEPCVQKMQDMV